MPTRVNTPERLEAARSKIGALLAAQAEWFCTLTAGTTQAQKTEALGRSELDIRVAHGRLILTHWTEKGTRSWKIFSWEWTGEKLTLEASRKMGAERPVIELVPRAAASAIALTVKVARQVRCDGLARLACAMQSGAKVERSSLSPGARRGQPGRYARVVLRQRHQLIAVTGSVSTSKPGEVDAFLSSALLWFKRTSERARPPYIQQLWLLVESRLVKPTIQRLALLRTALRESIAVYEVDQALTGLKPIEVPSREDLWKRRLARFPPIPLAAPSEITSRLIAV